MNPSETTTDSPPRTAQRKSRVAHITITFALGISVGLNVLLAHKLRIVTGEQWGRLADRPLKIAASVPPITVKRLDGQQEVISYKTTNQSTVLYIFTPPCTWCARNLDNFKTLVDKENDQYRFIGLSLSEEGLAEYVAKNQLKLPVYSGVSTEAKETYKLSGTPQTIVVSPEGKILQDWLGAYVGEQKKEIEAYFHVDLPGIRELQQEKEKKAAN